MRYKIPAGYLPVVALIAVQTLGALTAGPAVAHALDRELAACSGVRSG